MVGAPLTDPFEPIRKPSAEWKEPVSESGFRIDFFAGIFVLTFVILYYTYVNVVKRKIPQALCSTL